MDTSKTIALCMIVKDEAFFIEDCLASAAPHVDEIVVVETGSSDGTGELAARFTDKVLDFEWIDDFAAARNVGLQAATSDWILVLDADERMTGEDYRALRQAMQTDDYDGYYLKTRNYTHNSLRSDFIPVSGEDPMARGHPGYCTHPILKFFRRRDDIYYRGRIHEIVDYTVEEGRRGTLDAVIHHYGEANPDRPKKERTLRYLAMMEEEPDFFDDPRLLTMAGSAAMYFAEDYSKAQRYYARSAELGFEPEKGLHAAAEAAYRGGNLAEAHSMYRALYDSGFRTPALCLNLANLTVRSGNKSIAVALLKESLELGGLGGEIDETVRKNISLLED